MKVFLYFIYLFFFTLSHSAIALSETDSKAVINREIQTLMRDMEGLVSQAEKGDTDSQYKLGLVYVYTNQFSLAKQWLQAAEKNSPKARYALAYLLATSSGNDDNYVLDLFKRSADDDYTPAIHYMGLLYHYGGLHTIRMEQNNVKAEELFKRATLKGSLKSQAHLALFCFEGLGRCNSKEKAYILYLDAAQRGLYRAYSRLALDWHDRGGIDPNPEKYEEYWWKYKNNEDRKPFCGEDEQGRDYDCGDEGDPSNSLYMLFLHFEDYML